MSGRSLGFPLWISCLTSGRRRLGKFLPKDFSPTDPAAAFFLKKAGLFRAESRSLSLIDHVDDHAAAHQALQQFISQARQILQIGNADNVLQLVARQIAG